MSTTASPETTAGTATGARRQVDPRGPRFVAALTSLVLAVALLAAPSAVTVALLAVQAVVFGTGVALGIARTPYSWVFRTLVRPRLAPSTDLEDAAPPRFAQGVGLGFAVVALLGYLTGAGLLGSVATGFALAAAVLNAVFGLCLGCEVYLLLRRLVPARPTSA